MLFYESFLLIFLLGFKIVLETVPSSNAYVCKDLFFKLVG